MLFFVFSLLIIVLLSLLTNKVEYISKTCSLISDCCIILYADDMLLLSVSVTRVEQLLSCMHVNVNSLG